MKLAIIDYGAGNVKSIQFACKRLGVTAELSSDPEFIKKSDKVIFPGVGEASNAMKKLKENNLNQLIPVLQQPVLGICLGMQLLCKSTEEGSTNGFGVFDVNIKQFSSKVKVPQIGWNTISNLQGPLFKGVKDTEYMYLVHSYYAEQCNEMIATTNYEVNYASALQKDNFYGVQFHPEKSSKAGKQVLQNFLEL